MTPPNPPEPDADCRDCQGTGIVTLDYERDTNAWNDTDCDCIWQACTWPECYRKGDVMHDGQLVCSLHLVTARAQARLRGVA